MGWYQRRVHGVFNTLLTINLYHIYMNSVLSHKEISSNPFCLIQNCPWLVFIAQGFFFVILLSLNLYFWRIDGFPFSFHLIVIILFFCILCLINFYFIDLVREAYKKYEVLYIMLFIVFFIFIVSEALLFISFFWAALHVISSPDPCQLPYSNTVLLSHAACSLRAAFVGLEISCSSSIFFSFISLTLAWAFISLQIYEFWIMGISLVDSVYGSIFYFLTGLHFCHLIVGMMMVGMVFWAQTYQKSGYVLILRQITDIHLFYNLQIFYWHFLELL